MGTSCEIVTQRDCRAQEKTKKLLLARQSGIGSHPLSSHNRLSIAIKQGTGELEIGVECSSGFSSLRPRGKEQKRQHQVHGTLVELSSRSQLDP